MTPRYMGLLIICTQSGHPAGLSWAVTNMFMDSCVDWTGVLPKTIRIPLTDSVLIEMNWSLLTEAGRFSDRILRTLRINSTCQTQVSSLFKNLPGWTCAAEITSRNSSVIKIPIVVYKFRSSVLNSEPPPAAGACHPLSLHICVSAYLSAPQHSCTWSWTRRKVELHPDRCPAAAVPSLDTRGRCRYTNSAEVIPDTVLLHL